MRHPTDGTLRRLVDEPAGVADADRRHVATCPDCLAGLAAAREDAAAAGAALGGDVAAEADVETDVAWQRLSQTVAVQERPRSAAPAAGRRWRTALRSPVVAGVGIAALLAGGGVAAANDWFQIFRTEQIAPVSITQADLVELPDLSGYGDLEVLAEPDVHEVADAAAAEEATGLSVPQVAQLPQGVTGEPVLQVGGQVKAVFTFSTEEAAETAAEEGESLPAPPAGLDGNRFRLVAGPGLAAVWSSEQGLPALVVARAVAPTAQSSVVPFATARDYLLSLPGLPEDVAAQLRRVSADGTTLPVPVPAEHVTSSTAQVGGAPATVFTAENGTMSGVVWVDDGVVTAVAGSVSTDEVLSVARGLQDR